MFDMFYHSNKLCKAHHTRLISFSPEAYYEITTYYVYHTFLRLTANSIIAQLNIRFLHHRVFSFFLQPEVQRPDSNKTSLDVVSLRRRRKKTRGRQTHCRDLCVWECHKLACSLVWSSSLISHSQKQTDNCWKWFHFFSRGFQRVLFFRGGKHS